MENKYSENSPILQQYPNLPYAWHPTTTQDQITLLDYYKILKKRKKFIFIFIFFSVVSAAIFTLYLPKEYKAEASIMPLQTNSGNGLSAMAAQLPMLGELAGGAAGGGKSGQIVNILKSRTLAERIVNHFDLMHVFFKNRWDEVNKVWLPNWRGRIPVLEDAVNAVQKGLLKIQDDKKTGLIKIWVISPDSALATAIVNRSIVELQDFTTHNQLTVEKRNRIFVEEQLQKNKIELLKIGKRLNEFYGNNRISSSLPELDVNIGKMTNPPLSFEEFRDELAELNLKKENLVPKLTEEEKQGIVQNVPSQVYLQFLTLQRDLLMRVNIMLTQQYEMAKIDEAKEDLAFQVIDKAVIPIRPYSPNIKINVIIAFMGGLFLSVFIAFFQEYLEKIRKNDSNNV